MITHLTVNLKYEFGIVLKADGHFYSYMERFADCNMIPYILKESQFISYIKPVPGLNMPVYGRKPDFDILVTPFQGNSGAISSRRGTSSNGVSQIKDKIIYNLRSRIIMSKFRSRDVRVARRQPFSELGEVDQYIRLLVT